MAINHLIRLFFLFFNRSPRVEGRTLTFHPEVTVYNVESQGMNYAGANTHKHTEVNSCDRHRIIIYCNYIHVHTYHWRRLCVCVCVCVRWYIILNNGILRKLSKIVLLFWHLEYAILCRNLNEQTIDCRRCIKSLIVSEN